MAFSSSTVISGQVTKKTDYDRLMDNTVHILRSATTFSGAKTFQSATVFQGTATFSSTISSPQVCKAWCTFAGATTGTNAPTDGHNVASVERVSQSVYTVNFTNNLNNANYAIVICTTGITINIYHTKAVGSVGVNVYAQNGTLPPDPTEVSVHIFGT